MATSARGSSSLIFRSKSVPERLGQLQVGDDNVGRLRLNRGERGFGRFRFGANEIQALADGHAQPANTLFIIHDQKPESRFIPHGLPMVFSTAASSS